MTIKLPVMAMPPLLPMVVGKRHRLTKGWLPLLKGAWRRERLLRPRPSRRQSECRARALVFSLVW